jgi:hypothetical protein
MPDISTPNLDYNDMVEAWDINDALMGGTLEMRRQGEIYLPKWPNEDPEGYKQRPLRRCSHPMKRALSRISGAFC